MLTCRYEVLCRACAVGRTYFSFSSVSGIFGSFVCFLAEFVLLYVRVFVLYSAGSSFVFCSHLSGTACVVVFSYQVRRHLFYSYVPFPHYHNIRGDYYYYSFFSSHSLWPQYRMRLSPGFGISQDRHRVSCWWCSWVERERLNVTGMYKAKPREHVNFTAVWYSCSYIDQTDFTAANPTRGNVNQGVK